MSEEGRPKISELATVPIQPAQWYTLGLTLGLEEDVLNIIEVDKHAKCKQVMFQKWLESTPTASWDDLIKALKQIGEEETAEKVSEGFCLSQHSGLAEIHGDGNHGDDHHSNNSVVQEVDHGIH